MILLYSRLSFLAGGPGSGKSWVSKSALGGMGLKVIDSDGAFVSKLKKEKMTLNFAAHNEKEIIKEIRSDQNQNRLQVCS